MSAVAWPKHKYSDVDAVPHPDARLVALALVRSEGVQMTKALAGDLHAFRALQGSPSRAQDGCSEGEAGLVRVRREHRCWWIVDEEAACPATATQQLPHRSNIPSRWPTAPK
jgi:hypothetical protein